MNGVDRRDKYSENVNYELLDYAEYMMSQILFTA